MSIFGREIRLALSALALSVSALACALSQAVQAQAKPARASPAVQQEFDGFIRKFRAAVKANDPAGVAVMTKLPFYFDDANRDDAYFRAKAYPFHFNAKNRACLQTSKPVYDRDGLNQDNFFVFCGQRIFVFTKTPAGFLFTDVSAND